VRPHCGISVLFFFWLFHPVTAGFFSKRGFEPSAALRELHSLLSLPPPPPQINPLTVSHLCWEVRVHAGVVFLDTFRGRTVSRRCLNDSLQLLPAGAYAALCPRLLHCCKIGDLRLRSGDVPFLFISKQHALMYSVPLCTAFLGLCAFRSSFLRETRPGLVPLSPSTTGCELCIHDAIPS